LRHQGKCTYSDSGGKRGQLQRAAAHVVLDVLLSHDGYGGYVSGAATATLAHQLDHLAGGFAAVAVGVFDFNGQLREGFAELGDEHHRVEAEAVAPRGSGAICPATRPEAISGSGSSADRTATSVLTSAARRWKARSSRPFAQARP
jgi:hypothetical protein